MWVFHPAWIGIWKTREPGEKPSEQTDNQPTTNSTHIRHWASIESCSINWQGASALTTALSLLPCHWVLIYQKEIKPSVGYTFYKIMSTAVPCCSIPNTGDVSCFGHDCYMLAFGVPALLMILSIGVWLASLSFYFKFTCRLPAQFKTAIQNIYQ